MRIVCSTLALLLGAGLAPPAHASFVHLSEVFYDAVGSDADLVFVELYGSPGLSLELHELVGINGSNGAEGPVVALSGVVPADGFFVVADGDAGVTQVSEADLVLSFDFQNGPDSIVLRGPDGAVLDAVGYGDFADAVFAGEGAPAPDPPAGQSLARLFADVDTHDNARDFIALEQPSPGRGPVSVPEPTLALLIWPCLAFLLRSRALSTRTPRESVSASPQRAVGGASARISTRRRQLHAPAVR